MLKATHSVYKGGTRTLWGKLKFSSGSFSETLDLVPIAGYWGKGKRN